MSCAIFLVRKSDRVHLLVNWYAVYLLAYWLSKYKNTIELNGNTGYVYISLPNL